MNWYGIPPRPSSAEQGNPVSVGNPLKSAKTGFVLSGITATKAAVKAKIRIPEKSILGASKILVTFIFDIEDCNFSFGSIVFK